MKRTSDEQMNPSTSNELTSKRLFNLCSERNVDDKVKEKDGLITKTTDLHQYVYAQHEALVSAGAGEADLYNDVECLKNPKHTGFQPVDTFELKHLPENFRTQYYFDFIRATIDFTVKIDVKTTSPGRPEFWDRTSSPYPFYTMRNSFQLRSGTGSMRSVYKYNRGFDAEGVAHREMYTFCVCEHCRKSETPSKVWWELEIMTATHLVFDDIEASHAECVLFYNHLKSEVVKLDTVVLDYANIETDKAWLRCVTCDSNLIAKLDEMSKHYNEMFKNLYIHTMQIQQIEKIAIIVSHPHGCPKHLSFGKWLKRHSLDDDENVSAYTYETPTCTGTSGATVYIMGHHNGQRYMYSDHHVHVGVSGEGINYCGNGYDDAF